VAIARVLAGDPKLILADEPTGNLDSLMAREIMDLLDRINAEGTTIVMVTHSPECAVRSQRQIHVLDGRVVDVAMPHISLARTEASAGVASTLG
jgi:putative ABC transport system ATP-binding protein